MIVDIPDEEAESVAVAIRAHAHWFRNDKGHPLEGIIELNKAADALDAIAGDIEERLERIEADAVCPACEVKS